MRELVLHRVRVIGLGLALVSAFAAAGLGLSKCDTGRPGSPFTKAAQVTVHRTTLAPNSCTRAYGQCWVTEYRQHLRNGVVRIWTCFAQPPVKPGASNIWIAVDDCFRP